MREVNLKRLHITFSQLHDILKKQNFGYSTKISGLQKLEEAGEEQISNTQDF